MKNKKETVEITKPQESGKSWFIANVNTCIACGREIPEGMLACMECEKGVESALCVVCDEPLKENEISICSRCRAVLLHSRNKDQK